MAPWHSTPRLLRGFRLLLCGQACPHLGLPLKSCGMQRSSESLVVHVRVALTTMVWEAQNVPDQSRRSSQRLWKGCVILSVSGPKSLGDAEGSSEQDRQLRSIFRRRHVGHAGCMEQSQSRHYQPHFAERDLRLKPVDFEPVSNESRRTYGLMHVLVVF